MKNYLVLLILLITSCRNPESLGVKKIPLQIKKVVSAKKESLETKSEFVEESRWDAYNQYIPNTYTVYYLIFSDNSFTKVDIGIYTNTQIGDTITTFH